MDLSIFRGIVQANAVHVCPRRVSRRLLRDNARLLLVLDRFEQVIPAKPVVAHLLAAYPPLMALATSGIALRVRAEWAWEYRLAAADLDRLGVLGPRFGWPGWLTDNQTRP